MCGESAGRGGTGPALAVCCAANYIMRSELMNVIILHIEGMANDASAPRSLANMLSMLG